MLLEGLLDKQFYALELAIQQKMCTLKTTITAKSKPYLKMFSPVNWDGSDNPFNTELQNIFF